MAPERKPGNSSRSTNPSNLIIENGRHLNLFLVMFLSCNMWPQHPTENTVKISQKGRTPEVLPHAEKSSLICQNNPIRGIFLQFPTHTQIIMRFYSRGKEGMSYFTKDHLRVSVYGAVILQGIVVSSKIFMLDIWFHPASWVCELPFPFFLLLSLAPAPSPVLWTLPIAKNSGALADTGLWYPALFQIPLGEL